MKTSKTLLVVKVSSLSVEVLQKYQNLPYTKVCLMYRGEKVLPVLKNTSKIIFMQYKNLTDFPSKINELYKKYMEYTLIPHFSGDSNSKYAIKIYNKSFGTRINPKIFKEKDEMMRFL